MRRWVRFHEVFYCFQSLQLLTTAFSVCTKKYRFPMVCCLEKALEVPAERLQPDMLWFDPDTSMDAWEVNDRDTIYVFGLSP
jgi:hypothetical protein